MSDLITALGGFGPFRVLVVGDFMLDEFVHGDASRLSPDAPVPVLTVTETERAGGGASNVATCLAGFGGLVQCCGVIGGDTAGSQLTESLTSKGCAVDGLVVDADRPTTVKRNLIGLAQHRHPQKMFRMDIESHSPLAPSTNQSLADCIETLMSGVNAVCIEDYGKGVCTPERCEAVIACARRQGIPVLVDPAAIDCYERYRGATIMTPNRTEAARACALLPGAPDTPEMMAAALLDVCELEAIVITLDRHGALLLERGKKPVLIPAEQRDVYDVTGAGDMVLAALTAATCHGLSWVDAVHLANASAGLVVEKFGAHAIPLARVSSEVLRLHANLEGKVRSIEELLLELAAHREAGHRVVLTNGCFDVIHAGHVAYLRDAKSQGDTLVVGLNSDDQVSAMKGEGRPVYGLSDRASILSELACIDFVVPFEESTAHNLIDAVRPDLYVKGGDYAPEEIVEYDHCVNLGVPVSVLAHRPGLGSTDIVEQVRRG